MTIYNKLPLSALFRYGKPDEEAVHKLFLKEYKDFHRKVIVLDDDPTGIQTVHNVPVYTDWSKESLLEGMEDEEQMFFVLTNSRSFTARETMQMHREFVDCMMDAAQECHKEILLISRGDSTLRGHYPLELEVLRDSLEEKTGRKADGQIILPYFKEGGRYTIDSVHYVKEGEWLVPAGQTEFAEDKTFGYKASHLGEYAEEKSGGHYRKEDCVYITLSLLRNQKVDEIVRMLLEAHDFQPIIVDSVCDSDVELFAVCLLKALAKGIGKGDKKEFLMRSAAALPKVLGNVTDRVLLTKEELTDSSTEGYGGLVVIGSHVEKTTRQLKALRESGIAAKYLEFDVNACFQSKGIWPEGIKSETKRLIQEAEMVMEKGETAVIYTSRKLLMPESAKGEDLLELSVRISNALTEVVLGLHKKPRFLIAKGGITSSDIGTKGLKVKKAMVMGQVSPGIPVWKTGSESRFPGLSYIIFPGNVGEIDTLKKIVEKLM